MNTTAPLIKLRSWGNFVTSSLWEPSIRAV